jgi:hypothetical protein
MMKKLITLYIPILFLLSIGSCKIEPEITPADLFSIEVADSIKTGNSYSEVTILYNPEHPEPDISKRKFSLSLSEDAKFQNGTNAMTVEIIDNKATALIRSSKAYTCVLSVEPNELSDYAQKRNIVFYTPDTSNSLEIQVTPETMDVPANDIDVYTIVATIPEDLVIDTAKVRLFTPLGTFSNNSQNIVLIPNNQRKVTTSIKSSSPGIASIFMNFRGINETFSINFLPVASNEMIEIEVTDPQATADGVDIIHVEAQLLNFTPGANQTILLTATNGTWLGTSSSSTSLTANYEGRVSANLKSQSPGISAITATYSIWSVSDNGTFTFSDPDYLQLTSSDYTPSENSPQTLTTKLLRNIGTPNSGLSAFYTCLDTNIIITAVTPAELTGNSVVSTAQFWNSNPNFQGNVEIKSSVIRFQGDTISTSTFITFE